MVATAIPSEYGTAATNAVPTPRKLAKTSSSTSSTESGDELPQFDSSASLVLLEHPDDSDGEEEPQQQQQQTEPNPVKRKVSYQDMAVYDSSSKAQVEVVTADADLFKHQEPVVASRKPFRRATTIAVPLSVMTKQHQRDSVSTTGDDNYTSELGDTMVSPAARPLVRSQSCPQRAAAVEAISNRDVRFRFSTAASARESVREMYSHRFREYPTECYRDAEVEIQVGPVWRKMRAEIHREGFSCVRTSVFRKKSKEIRVPNDDILGATLASGSQEMVLHYMLPGKGRHEKKLKRQYKTVGVRFSDRKAAEQWTHAIQMLVKWLARVPLECSRKIKVVVNPHSGKRRGRQIYQKWKPLFELAGIQCDMEETKYSGHARDIGVSLDLREKYEALVFVGGDGTVNEFMNGIFSREESEWRNVVATTPVSLLSAGTDNAFGLGVGTPTHEASVYCIIKRKIRPLDVITCEGEREDGTTHREYACCGISYGIGGDIAMESEKMRWMGIYRYAFLKVKRGVFAPRRHEAKLKYVLAEDVETDPTSGNQVLRTYYDIADRDARDQHHIELCSVYDDSTSEKRWNGDASSIFHPASEEKYAGKWRSEEHSYGTVGASNVYFETEYAHPSDGNMDLVIVRKGPFLKIVDVAWRYVAGNYLDSSLVDYFKIKAMVIEQAVPDPINVDGEVFPGPGPFRIEIVPQLLCVLSEK